MSANASRKSANGLSDHHPASLLQEPLACGVLVIGKGGKITASSVDASLQFSPDQPQAASLSVLPPPLARLVRDAAKSGKTVFNREIQLGKATTLRITVLPVQGNAAAEMVVILNRPSLAPAVEQNLRRLDRLAGLGTLSASMAHEIKNGMVAVKTFVDMLAQKGQDTELTEIVGRELARINAIVTQMLRFATPHQAAFATVRVHELLDHSLRLMQHQIGGKLISLQRNYRAQPDTVRGDDAQLQQVFMNLLLNALEAMGTNGVLTVSTDLGRDDEGVTLLQLTIQDTGIGIAPEHQERLFEPFFTTKKHGTGLGLAISRRILREHNGTICVRSESGKGSTFSLSLPVFEIVQRAGKT